jgi:hypothetical protein
MATKKVIKKKEPVILTDDEKILGVTKEEKEKTYFNYEDPDVYYDVKNYKNGRTTRVSGRQIEFFIGSRQTQAREAIISGEKSVIIYNPFSKDGEKEKMYKIEVVE